MNKTVFAAVAAFVLAGCAANETFREGRAMVEAGQVDEGLARIEDAMRRDPYDPEIRNFYLRNRALALQRYIAIGDDQIPLDLVEAAHRVYSGLCATQRQPTLLHGDLQHYNVLFDSSRGWLAIDPKGVIGELEFEIGPVLRNPIERPELFLSRSTIERRLKQFTSRLHLDYERALAWGFAQAVLSGIWDIEDGFVVDATNPSLRLAETIRPKT